MIVLISFTLNGRPVSLATDGDRPLLWVLREDLGLTGTKYGCGIGECGACTVLLNGRAIRSCHTAVKKVAGGTVITIEGLAGDAELHPLQQAFIDHYALQCGFCTPGMILAAVALLGRKPHPTREEIIEALDRNLCRCGSYSGIVDAIEVVAGAPGAGGVR